MGRIPTVASTSHAPPAANVAPAASPDASGSRHYEQIAPPSDLPSIWDERTAKRMLEAACDGEFSSDEEVVTLAVLGGNGATAKRMSELLADTIN